MSDIKELTAAMEQPAAETAAVPVTPPVLTPEIVIPHKLTFAEGKCYRLIEEDGFEGYGEVPHGALPKPYIHWKGPKISFPLWRSICAFFEWSNDKLHAEAQVRLYVNHDTGLIHAWAFPQRCVGMTTEELEDHPDWNENEAKLKAIAGDRAVMVGTVHHHCSGTAFQSSVDRAGESGMKSFINGLHITVGKIGSNEYEIHGRTVLNRNQQTACVHDWFEPPEGEDWSTLPASLQQWKGDLLLWLLQCPPPDDTPFPNDWKFNCKTTYYHGSSHSGHQHGFPPRGSTAGPYSPPPPAPSPPTGKVAVSVPASVVGNGDYSPKQASADSTGTPGSGAGTHKEPRIIGVAARITRALKDVHIQPPDAEEAEFVSQFVDMSYMSSLHEDRIFELVCWAMGTEPQEVHSHLQDVERSRDINPFPTGANPRDDEAYRQIYGDY